MAGGGWLRRVARTIDEFRGNAVFASLEYDKLMREHIFQSPIFKHMEGT